jgi:hypothetical protein
MQTSTPVASPARAAPNGASGPQGGGQQTSPGVQAAADLEAILARMMKLDVEGWFRHPVKESIAPNYYKIIKRPMCFEVGAELLLKPCKA